MMNNKNKRISYETLLDKALSKKTCTPSRTTRIYLAVKGLSTNLPSESVHESSNVTQIYAVVHGAVVWPVLTRHDSLVLKFFLHFSQTARRLSGNLTFST